MDTRSKIVTLDRLPRPIALVTAYFDFLCMDHARVLEEVKHRNSQLPIVVLILRHGGELVNEAARARMAAALRVVDYVLIADQEDPEVALERLRPAVVVRLEEAELRGSRLLIEHVQHRQIG